MNNPLNTIYPQLLPGGIDDSRDFVAQLRQAAERAHVPFFDPLPGGFGDPQLYADATHLNQAGVSWITGALADFLVQQGMVGGPGMKWRSAMVPPGTPCARRRRPVPSG